ncbi:MAG: cytochrome c [Deltaproteobacteria bacterium]|nr:cytochrome c [Deltaproteobacteria bacterium]MBI3386886.1 cytochrome c [Deltaproteobacteria bacterium]
MTTKSGPRCRAGLLAAAAVFALATAYGAWMFLRDVAVDYAGEEDHFKYGSTGGERASGLPYWIWRAIPELFPEYLPDPSGGYASLGFIFEDRNDLPDKSLPVGISKRHYRGIDRVYLNCAACHTGRVRDTPASPPRVIAGMPANTFDLGAFRDFLFTIALDAKFNSERFMLTIDQLGARLGLLDRYVVYPLAVYLVRERLLMLRSRLQFTNHPPWWGPGRVDTFNQPKALLNFRMDNAPPQELIGNNDFPSVWNQRPREGMRLHWDGNNSIVDERDRSAAFGTGAFPPTLDRASLARVERYLLDAKPPAYPYPINQGLAARGQLLYREYCAGCHATDGTHFRPGDGKVGTVEPIAAIKTDPWRLNSYTYELALNQSQLYAGYGAERFRHFRKTFGYANTPLDGVWLRGPYLHNGSVPTLRDLLEPSAKRPEFFYRGDDVYDAHRVGFRSDVGAENGHRYFPFDTGEPGNGNFGHEGAAFGTELRAADKDALVEYLKTF